MANETCCKCNIEMIALCKRLYKNDTPPCAVLVDKNFNSLQQLKAEIAALENAATRALNRGDIEALHLILNDLRQLSAV